MTTANGRRRGVVKFFLNGFSYGFLTVPGEPDVYVHAKALRNAGILKIDTGDVVTFELVANPRNGKQEAINIELAN